MHHNNSRLRVAQGRAGRAGHGDTVLKMNEIEPEGTNE
jgi:hypothetical protein